MADLRVTDKNRNGKVDPTEYQDLKVAAGTDAAATSVEIVDPEGKVQTTVKLSDLQAGVEGANKAYAYQAAADARSPSDVTPEEQAKIQSELEKAMAEFENAKKSKDPEVIEAKQKALQEVVKKAQEAVARGAAIKDFDKALKESGMGDSKSTMKAMVQSNSSSGGSGTANGTNTASGAKAQTMTSSYPPAGWSAQTTDSASFSSDAYLASLSTTDDIMASWDSISSNQSKGKQLMQLFYYFAKMAESGDMGAMYQFMKFVTYIISKDKAKQQIEMGKKLIELQDLSREWTNKLTGLSTSTDAASSNELMKTMTLVKSETDAIATSQKLVSQMMEEFAQVVETLTNTTKSALETNGRIQRTVSRFSA